jgi:hypothetical protein
MAYLIAALDFGWFIWTAISNRPLDAASHYLPGWVATMIWASWLILLPVGILSTAHALRVSMAVLFLISSLLLPLAFHSNPGATVLFGMGILIEGLWLIQWRDKRRRNSEKTGGDLTE